jgi:4-hydroxy-tetrahydrodipicolinate synthase
MSLDLVRTRLHGVMAVPVTPFAEDQSLDELAQHRVIKRIVSAGIEVVVPCGNTSEFSALTAGEAQTCVEVAVAAAGRDATVIAGVGRDVATATSMARQAIAAGAGGIMIHQPSDPYVTDAGLCRYYQTIAQAAEGAVTLYVRERPLSDDVFREILPLENVVGVKFGIPSVLEIERLVREFDREVVWICGLGELWTPFFWLVGARGFTSGGLANVAPELAVEFLRRLRRDDYPAAMELWARIAPLERLRARHTNGNNVSAVKAALALILGLPATVRPPVAALCEEELVELKQIIAQLPAAPPRDGSDVASGHGEEGTSALAQPG